MLHYPVKLTTEGEYILVDFPDFPEAHTFGDTREEALRRASDALLTVIEAYMKDRQRLPQPSRGKLTVTVPPLTVPKIELYKAMQQKRITKAELGRRLGWHMPQVDRILDVRHASRMDRLQQALQAVDRRLEVTVVEA
jgi:antitoxin HicB